MLITPINVIITVVEGGVTGDNPITMPITPVTKNIIIKTLTLVGSMYLMTCVKHGIIIN